MVQQILRNLTDFRGQLQDFSRVRNLQDDFWREKLENFSLHKWHSFLFTT